MAFKGLFPALLAITFASSAIAAPQPTSVIVVGSPGVDGSASIPNAAPGDSIVLFNGATPSNGFQVQIQDNSLLCPAYVSDDPKNTYGFVIQTPSPSLTPAGSWPTMYTSPPGYKPIGPVTVTVATCSLSGQAMNIAARMW
jgi:hypothetical protein